MRRLQKVQFEDGLQRERAVNVQFVKTFILNTFTCLNIQGSKQLNDFFFLANLKQSKVMINIQQNIGMKCNI